MELRNDKLDAMWRMHAEDLAQCEVEPLAWHAAVLEAALSAASGRVRVLESALRRAHACATLRDDGTCDGCPVSAALGAEK